MWRACRVEFNADDLSSEREIDVVRQATCTRTAGDLWRERARAFAENWDGTTGVDTDLVDPEALRAAWRTENPVFGSITPLYAAWLASSART